MTDAERAQKLESIFLDVMKEETVPVRQRTKTNCAHWDSITQLSIISSIEQEFAIRIADEDVLDLNSFEAALHIVTEKMTQQPAR
ncbi:MAG TPA: acyl carrier protein [Elusimicrobiota bacterium]|jgi:acyl carrier protein|nr:acyl carrier protein [Elusimicrobiota bacterium]